MTTCLALPNLAADEDIVLTAGDNAREIQEGLYEKINEKEAAVVTAYYPKKQIGGEIASENYYF